MAPRVYREGMPDFLPLYRGPVKRSVTIAGHQTSISLEPVFWTALGEAANELELPLNALVAKIDFERISAEDPPNLASAIRLWLFSRAMGASKPFSG